MTILRGGTPARHVRSNSEGSCDYGEILATSTVPLQKAGPKHQSSSALDAMGRGGSGSLTPSSGYITPRTGTATPIQPSSKVMNPLFSPCSFPGQKGFRRLATKELTLGACVAGRCSVPQQASRDTTRRISAVPRHAVRGQPRVHGREIPSGRIAAGGFAVGDHTVCAQIPTNTAPNPESQIPNFSLEEWLSVLKALLRPLFFNLDYIQHLLAASLV
jgi:hypothetical protein